MKKGEILWEVPLGSIDKMLPVTLPWEMDLSLGTPGAGGPLLTAGGLVFIGYTLDELDNDITTCVSIRNVAPLRFCHRGEEFFVYLFPKSPELHTFLFLTTNNDTCECAE